MAHLYLNRDSDSIYLDVTAGDVSPVDMIEAAAGVYFHVDDGGNVVAVEVLDVGRRYPGDVAPTLGHLHLNPATDSLYLDISAGSRTPIRSTAVTDGVLVHADGAGALVAVEVTELSRRGGLRVDDLDTQPGERCPLFDEIERAATSSML